MALVAFDDTKPANGAPRSSLVIRQQLTALQGSIAGLPGNMVRDCGYEIRSTGETAAADHWRFSGAGCSIAYAGVGLSDTIHGEEDTCAKITSAGGVNGLLEQTLIGTSGFKTSMRGRWVSLGGNLRCAVGSKLRLGIYDGAVWDSTVWVELVVTDVMTWLSRAVQLSNSADRVVVRSEILSGPNTGYVADVAVKDGPVPPAGPMMSAATPLLCGPSTQQNNLIVGTYIGGWRGFMPRPCRIMRTDIVAGTAPTGADALIDVNKNNATMYATKPKLVAGNTTGGAAPDGTYAARCFARGDIISVDQDTIGSTVPGADQTILIEGRVFIPPQEDRLGITDMN